MTKQLDAEGVIYHVLNKGVARGDLAAYRTHDVLSRAQQGHMDFAYHWARMLLAWAGYAVAHRMRYESPIGDDGVLGPAWQAQGEALLTLLNGERGELDGGLCDRIVRAVLANEGCETE